MASPLGMETGNLLQQFDTPNLSSMNSISDSVDHHQLGPLVLRAVDGFEDLGDAEALIVIHDHALEGGDRLAALRIEPQGFLVSVSASGGIADCCSSTPARRNISRKRLRSVAHSSWRCSKSTRSCQRSQAT